MSNKILLFFAFCLFGISCSQTNYKPISISKRGELRDNYVKYGVEVLGMKDTSVLHNLFYRRLNLKRLEELKEVTNQNILFSRYNQMKNNHVTASITRPQVIIGTVEEETRDTREGAYFRLQWKVKVEEIIADDGDEIYVKNGEDVFIKASGLPILCPYIPRLSEGEDVLLFLSPIRKSANRRFISLNEEILSKFNIDNVKDIKNTYTIAYVFSIKNGILFTKEHMSRFGKLRKIKKQIKQIIKINNRHQFYQDFKN